MHDPQDRQAFATAMAQLSMALNTIELTNQHLDVYWSALQDLGIDGVVAACADLARHFTPKYTQRFPVPATIREHVHLYRASQRSLAQSQALLPTASPVPDAEALAHVRDIIAMLDEKMDMRYASRETEAAQRAQRKAQLLAQAEHLRDHDSPREEAVDAD